jgi:nucleotide-binding universal stress UspA family protein
MVAEYVARACAGARGPDTKLVLFTMLPGLPPWIEASESGDAMAKREKFEAETRERTARILAEVRQYFVAHGVNDGIIAEEIADESPRIVPDILAAATRHGCDTIVMARHHKSMVREFFAGDPEEKLLRHPTGFTVWLVE